MPGFANIWGKITPSAGVQTVRHIVSAEKLTIISKIIDLIALGMDGERENVKRDVIAGQRLEEGTILNHYNSTGFQLLKRTLSYEVCQEDLRYWKKSYLTYKTISDWGYEVCQLDLGYSLQFGFSGQLPQMTKTWVMRCVIGTLGTLGRDPDEVQPCVNCHEIFQADFVFGQSFQSVS